VQVFRLIAHWAPGPFLLRGFPADYDAVVPLLQYYSFITLTSLDFGDITAVHPVARSMTVLEALIGVRTRPSCLRVWYRWKEPTRIRTSIPGAPAHRLAPSVRAARVAPRGRRARRGAHRRRGRMGSGAARGPPAEPGLAQGGLQLWAVASPEPVGVRRAAHLQSERHAPPDPLRHLRRLYRSGPSPGTSSPSSPTRARSTRS
jgi:hypothetical protein